MTYINLTPFALSLEQVGQENQAMCWFEGCYGRALWLMEPAAHTSPGWDLPAPSSTFTGGYSVLKSRKTPSWLEVMIPSKMKTSEILYSHKFNILRPISDFSLCHPKQQDPFISCMPFNRISYLFLYFLPGILVALYFIFIKNWSRAAIIFEMQLLFPQYVKQIKNKC